MRRATSWRPLLRMAARDALRSRARSILILVMIGLPVLAVTAAVVVIATGEIEGSEAVDRRLGAADAGVTFVGTRDVAQMPDPNRASTWGGTPPKENAPGLDRVAEVLGREVTGTERREGSVRVRTDAGATDIEVTELDLHAPVAEGLFRLVEGRLPDHPGETVVTPGLADRGPGPGEELEVLEGRGAEATTLDVVGVVEDATRRDARRAVAPAGGFALQGGGSLYADSNAAEWLVDSAAPVTWEEVLALNEAGALVVSRAVLADPPPPSAVPHYDGLTHSGSFDQAVLAVFALVVTMALIEVVLLAGPAFAVGARRQQRTLALVAATGGTPSQMRRIILASAVVLGAAASVIGVVGGVAAAWLLLPVVQRFSGEWLGPFDVPWWQVLVIAGFGLLSAVLAAVVPAWLASRQNVVAVLAGRRGDPRPGFGFPLLGLVLLGAGIAAAAMGARQQSMGEFWIAGSALPTVLGMVLLIPVVVAVVARLARRLPLPLRFAARDAARHRTRTVPAVAAVAATVMGVVALGIGVTSDEAQSREEYRAQLPLGDGALSYTPYEEGRDEQTWQRLRSAVVERVPESTVVPMVGLPDEVGRNRFREVSFRVDGKRLYADYSSAFGSGVLVGGSLPAADVGVSAAQQARADEVLADGGAVVFVPPPGSDMPSPGLRSGDESTVQLRSVVHGMRRQVERSPVVDVEALFVTAERGYPLVAAVVAPAVADALGAEPVETGLVVRGPLEQSLEDDLSEAVAAITPSASFTVERGYEGSDEYVIVLLVLGALGGLLMLGGTLTATFLALSDARPDLATLSAVGSAPRTRRAVAAAYALVVGLVGAVVGAAVGMVPGIAVTYPLTRGYDASDTGHHLDIPWLLIGAVVVALPLLAAAMVALFARSRLPMVARID